MTAADPIGDDEFARRMHELGLTPSLGPVAVAVSGGPDSLALALLAGRWGAVVALTFDHGLRPDSAGEAAQVADWLAPHGIEHHILSWAGPKPETAIQERAREARYTALEDFCRERKIPWLLLGHHQDDQAETFLMRLARGSGVDGLSAMGPVSAPLTGDHDQPQLGRPFLDVAKARMAATLEAMGQDWIDDPSNEESAFERVRMRRLLPVLQREGIGAAKLAESARRLRRSRSALRTMTDELLSMSAHRHQAGFVRLDRSAWGDWQAEFRLRSLARCLMCVGGRRDPPRMTQLEALDSQLRAWNDVTTTLGGCLIKSAGRLIDVIREAADLEMAEIAPGETMNWDGRFRISNRAGETVRVGPLGTDGWARLPADVRERWRTGDHLPNETVLAPYEAALALPTVFDGQLLTAVPYLAFGRRGGESIGVEWDPTTPLF